MPFRGRQAINLEMDREMSMTIPFLEDWEKEHLDPEIRDIVLALNRLGYITVMSCAGHHDNGRGSKMGAIDLVRGPRHEAIRAILSHAGLKGIRVRKLRRIPPYITDKGVTEVTRANFAGIGAFGTERIQQMMKRGVWPT